MTRTARKARWSPSTTASADVGRELELVFDVLRREALAGRGGGEVAHAVDHHELAGRLEIAGVARVHPALAKIGARRRLVLVVALNM